MMSVRQFAVIGYPLLHTMSPPIHKKLFALQGEPSANYLTCEIPTSELSQKIAMLKDLDGFNITIPHKLAIIPFLDRLDASAERYKAVNVVKHDRSTGKHIGYNTDVNGFYKAIEQVQADFSGTVCILGAGGAARMFAIESALQGAKIVIAVRHLDERVQSLERDVLAIVPSAEVLICTLDSVLKYAPFSLLINATPVGMYPHIDACPVSDDVIRHSKVIFDAIYNPNVTVLMAKAASMGCLVVGGMAMLVWQAAVAHTIWDNVTYQSHDITALIEEMKQNLVGI